MSNIKELIRDEIERRLKDYWKICFQDAKAYNEDSNVRELKELLSFLDTMPDEPVTDCHDLTEAARQYVRSRPFAPDESEPESTRKAFIAGAEWQRKQDEENYAWVKQLPNPNIEKLDGIEITTSDSSAGGKELLYVSNKSYNIGFRDGMAEQKRKMMEGAVEGVVYRYESYQRIATAIIVDVPKESLGNKVKIIIVKED